MPSGSEGRCTQCGAVFPMRHAGEAAGGGPACPVCGDTVIQRLPGVERRANTRCGNCESTFPRREAATDVKGVLACPVCGSTSDLESLGDDDPVDPDG